MTPKLCSRVCRLTAVRLRIRSPRQHLAELLKLAAGKCGQRFRHFRHVAESHEAAAPVGQFADVFSSSALFQLASRIPARSRAAPGAAPHATVPRCRSPPARGQRRDQAVENTLHAWHQVIGGEQPRGSTPKVEKARAFSCTALRSFSNSTITIAIPSTICGTGPSKSENCT